MKAPVRIADRRASGKMQLEPVSAAPMMTTMEWKQVIERWHALPPEEQSRRRRLRIPLNVAEGMAFEGQPVDLEMLEAEHARYNSRPDESKLDVASSWPRS